MSLHFAYLALYILVPIAGISLNAYVLSKLLLIARKSVVRFETTSGLPLAAMSVSDSVTLLAQLIQAIFHAVPKDGVPHFFLDGICKVQNPCRNTGGYGYQVPTREENGLDIFSETYKCIFSDTAHVLHRHSSRNSESGQLCGSHVDIYLMHTTSAFSVWCWLALSLLRYTAVFHPIKYRTIWNQPRHALRGLILMCSLFEAWILFTVIYQSEGPQKACAEDPDISPNTIKTGLLMDISLFYAIPSVLRIFFDGVVLFHCYAPFSMMDVPLYERRCAISGPTNRSFGKIQNSRRVSSGSNMDKELRSNVALVMSISAATTTSTQLSLKRRTYMKKKTAMVMRSIVISVLNLALNLPSHILRAWLTVDESAAKNQEALAVLEPISQLLYFSQFACNAFYLSTSIYETTGTPRSTVIANKGRQQVSRCISNDADTVATL